jgi:hypothetical protein
MTCQPPAFGRLSAGVILAAALLLLRGPASLSVALATDQESTASVITTDVFDPPSNLSCNAGLLACSLAFTVKPTLTWTATPDTYATGYGVYRSTTDGSGYVRIAGVIGRTTTTYTDNTVSALTTYYYVVRSEAAVWTSGFSAQVTVSVLL